MVILLKHKISNRVLCGQGTEQGELGNREASGFVEKNFYLITVYWRMLELKEVPPLNLFGLCSNVAARAGGWS